MGVYEDMSQLCNACPPQLIRSGSVYLRKEKKAGRCYSAHSAGCGHKRTGATR